MPASSPDLPVIRTLGGCGGTLVSRLFGALPRTVVLSETNPRSVHLFGGTLNPLRQLRQWRPELLEEVADFDDAEIGYPPAFGRMLQGLAATIARQDHRLIVRDFNYADFIGVPFIWPPPGDFSLDAALADRFTPRAIYLVRHPVDQLASLRTHRSLERVLSAEQFVAGAQAFLDARGGAPLFRYEDLTEAPETTFHAMCEALGVAHAPEALIRFTDVKTVTGSLVRAADTTITRGAPLPGADRARQELSKTPGYTRLIAALGYAA
ncbi:MAG TPA: hypothetical protein VGT07_02635 [Steroidobacteraceae bacterium]|nr:hypothetical protein [Steroidobacteraceae bacterium]